MNLEKKSHAFRNFKLAQILIFQKPNHPTALKRQTQSNQPKLTNSNQPTQPKPIEPNEPIQSNPSKPTNPKLIYPN